MRPNFTVSFARCMARPEDVSALFMTGTSTLWPLRSRGDAACRSSLTYLKAAITACAPPDSAAR
eukprot:11851201-Alexandrium_andersonii.AAC.1